MLAPVAAIRAARCQPEGSGDDRALSETCGGDRFILWRAVTCLHLFFFQADGGPSGFTLGLLALDCLPYAVCLLIALHGEGRPLFGFCAAAAALMVDVTTYYAVFLRRPQPACRAAGEPGPDGAAWNPCRLPRQPLVAPPGDGLKGSARQQRFGVPC